MRSITSVLLFLGGIALIFWAAKPLWEEISSIKQERSVVLETLAGLKSLEKARDDLLSAYNSIAKSDLEKLNKILPKGPDTGGALVYLEKITQDRGIRLKKVEFKTNTDKKEVKTIQTTNSIFNTLDLSFVISSGYDQFKSFLNSVERSSRLIDITNISFSVGEANLFEFTIQADAYYGKNVSKANNLQEITSLKIDTSLFSDPRFSGLESALATSSTEIKRGRTNPFLPI